MKYQILTLNLEEKKAIQTLLETAISNKSKDVDGVLFHLKQKIDKNLENHVKINAVKKSSKKKA